MLWKNVFYALLTPCLNNERQLNDLWVIVSQVYSCFMYFVGLYCVLTEAALLNYPQLLQYFGKSRCANKSIISQVA